MSIFNVTLEFAKAIGAFTVIGGAALAVANYTELRPIVVKEFKSVQVQIEELSKSQLYIQFQWLQEKEKREGLTFDERQTMCRIARVLDFRGIAGCGF